ncbi:hypothetical protein [Curtobacterium flaccumfaciens]|uniref:hypothetical protein n=1 Tax=Curtobacterium flaccumfaciens TaxID=2035 RepID=UPI003EB6A451
MEFSWWTWSGLMVLLLGAVGLFLRSAVIAVRRDGLGRGRVHRGSTAPWFWSAVGMFTVVGVLLVVWIILLDG